VNLPLAKRQYRLLVVMCAALSVSACLEQNAVVVGAQDNSESQATSLSDALNDAINAQYLRGREALILPDSDDYPKIPQDSNNPITAGKVALGQMLFHDTAFATGGESMETKTWSCASCHHAAAGFKAGIPQGIGEGGVNFGTKGADRVLSSAFNADGENGNTTLPTPDIQPLASPSILNSAYQDVMLWNGQFGNSTTGVINQSVPPEFLSTEGTPKVANTRELSGLETQAIAGLGVHRMNVEINSELQTNPQYQALFNAAYPQGSDDVLSDAGKAIAAFERTVLANEAPFQRWLKGDTKALTDAELRGGALFFGKAGCGDCHRGPALSSEVNATANEMFMAIGFADFDSANQPNVHGSISQSDKEGRGGFTKDPAEQYRFKIPPLYNLADTTVFGHGASFTSVRRVLLYKNQAVPQVAGIEDHLDNRFTPLGLTSLELGDLERFITQALYDANLKRYQPQSVPSGECIIVDPLTTQTQGLCP
jgi:cytochrome c peroxidase